MTPTYRHDREAELEARIADLESEVERLQRPGLWTRFGMWLWGGDVPNSRPPDSFLEAFTGMIFPLHEGRRRRTGSLEVKLSGEVVLPTGEGLPVALLDPEPFKVSTTAKAIMMDPETRNDGLSGLGGPLLEPLPRSAAGIPLPGALRDRPHGEVKNPHS